jgi:peroxiredoxin
MPKTIQSLQEANDWQLRHDPHAPKAGDPAPDFELRDSRGLNSVRLSDFRGAKPVALVFGSFT